MRKVFCHHLIAGFAIAMIVGGPFFVSAQSESKKKETLLVEADTLLGRQDFAGALSLLNKILDKTKTISAEDYPILYKRAYCYYALSDFENALTDINRYIAKTPDDQAKLLRAYINQELGNYEAQLTDLNEFLAANPQNQDLLRWRASVLMESEQYAEAQKDIQSLLVSQPGPELSTYLGLTYYYLDKPDSALLIFDEVIQGTPEYIQPYIYAASLSLEEEAYDLALQYIDKGLAAENTNLTLIFYKGVALVEDKKTEEGCRCLTKAFDGGMDDVADYLKSYCYGAN